MKPSIRRNVPQRVDFEQPITIVTDEAATPIQAEASNLSGSGVYVRCAQCLPESTLVQLQFALADEKPVSVIGSVARTVKAAQPGQPDGMGLYFVSFDQDAAAKIVNYALGQAPEEAVAPLSEKEALAARNDAS